MIKWAVLALVLAVTVLTVVAAGRILEASHGPTPSLELDADPTGNTADSFGTVDSCFQIGSGSTQTWTIDAVLDGAPPLASVQFDVDFTFSGSVAALQVDQLDPISIGSTGSPPF